MNSKSDVKINYINLVEMQEDACSKFSQNPIFGTKNGGAFEWITYAEFAEKVDQFRGGLATLGVGKDDKVAIISKNTVQWAVACYASFGLEAQFVPMYETQLPKVVFHTLGQIVPQARMWHNRQPPTGRCFC